MFNIVCIFLLIMFCQYQLNWFEIVFKLRWLKTAVLSKLRKVFDLHCFSVNGGFLNDPCQCLNTRFHVSCTGFPFKTPQSPPTAGICIDSKTGHCFGISASCHTSRPQLNPQQTPNVSPPKQNKMVQNKITEVTGFHRSFKVSLSDPQWDLINSMDLAIYCYSELYFVAWWLNSNFFPPQGPKSLWDRWIL